MRQFFLFTLLRSIIVAKALDALEPPLQPDLYLPAVLPANFSIRPSHWEHSTPLLQKSRPFDPLLRRANSVTRYWHGWQSLQYLFVFGDSYSATNFSISGIQPNEASPLGNPAYPGATSANGPNFVDFMTTTYNESLIETYDFAYGGATIDEAVVGSIFGPYVQSFKDQVNRLFQPKYINNPTVRWTGSNSLFMVFFGINDAIGTWPGPANDSLQYAEIKSYENIVNQMYMAGARNFLFMNIPPVDRAPLFSSLNATMRANVAGWIGRFNYRLSSVTYFLSQRYPDATPFYFETNFLFTLVLDDPTRFPETAGYRNSTTYCEAYLEWVMNRSIYAPGTMSYYDPSCNIPIDQYFWLNTLHPTYPMHNFLASQITRLLMS